MRRRIDTREGIALVQAYARGTELSVVEERKAVRFVLEEFATRHPGRSVEIRIPWVGAVQAIPGPVHTRGTPPNVVEMDGPTWLDLAIGREVADAAMSVSGVRADLTGYLPLFGPAQLRTTREEAADL